MPSSTAKGPRVPRDRHRPGRTGPSTSPSSGVALRGWLRAGSSSAKATPYGCLSSGSGSAVSGITTLRRRATLWASPPDAVCTRPCTPPFAPTCPEKSWDSSTSPSTQPRPGSKSVLLLARWPCTEGCILARHLSEPTHPPRSQSVDKRRFCSHEEVQRYLEAYARYFGLEQHVSFGTHVAACCRAGQGQEGVAWRVVYGPSDSVETEEATFDAVVVCNGHYSRPRVPEDVRDEGFPGAVMHSHNYREPEKFRCEHRLAHWGLYLCRPAC